jgi:hypothetical protein
VHTAVAALAVVQVLALALAASAQFALSGLATPVAFPRLALAIFHRKQYEPLY